MKYKWDISAQEFSTGSKVSECRIFLNVGDKTVSISGGSSVTINARLVPIYNPFESFVLGIFNFIRMSYGKIFGRNIC